MSLSDLTKEQKQYVVLGLLVVVILGFFAISGIKQSLQTMDDTKAQLEQITSEVHRSESTLSGQNHVNAEYAETVKQLEQYLSQDLPERNRYTWASKVIYPIAYETQLTIETIEEVSAPRNRKNTPNSISLESYSIRINATGSYDSVREFVRKVYEQHPLSRVAGLDISKGLTPESHRVQIQIQWLCKLNELEIK